ncbi:iron-sulfur cluster assembly scaffold protein [Paracoccus sp. (in: a-proteobacteria)]|uniref:iron-sulfur cluster assembly scaffold protein n=1 Tax=Paracoccus sp. TaxID=267 RepID=UPI0026E04DF6|nr:iron-sulfur cluster assembly scaffold protein [Paracoccus sp. (in: a-proteobacteria)]MDO5370239.1 iron-sulfur cluster assembly scaffold protein [Paracoccus sp. (in: a-proteobacteria)]
MADDDLMALYSRRLLALAADIPHLGRLPAPTGSATRRSPQCGSTVTAHVVVSDGVVTEFAQEVRACALGQASAAVLGGAVIGRSPAELAAGRDALRAMLTEGAPAPEGAFAAAEALTPARDFPNRHASILLAWEAVAEAAGA